jgi:hypothetical protein
MESHYSLFYLYKELPDSWNKQVSYPVIRTQPAVAWRANFKQYATHSNLPLGPYSAQRIWGKLRKLLNGRNLKTENIDFGPLSLYMPQADYIGLD